MISTAVHRWEVKVILSFTDHSHHHEQKQKHQHKSFDTTTMTTSTTTTATATATKSTSIWSDLPKRLLTVCVGFPLVCWILSVKQTAHLFFVGVHAIASYEWGSITFFLTNSNNIDNDNDDDDDDDNKKAKQQHQTQQQQQQATLPQHRYCRVAFFITSLLLAWIESDILFQLALMILVGTIVILSVVVINNSDENTTSRDSSLSSSSSFATMKLIAMTVVGYIFVTIPMRCWYYISTNSFSSTICVLLTVWNCDTGALVFGRISSTIVLLVMKFQHHHEEHHTTTTETKKKKKRRVLLPIPNWILKVSPSKSTEGFVGGIVGGCLTTMYLIPWMYNKSLLTSSTYTDNSISKFIMSILTWNSNDDTTTCTTNDDDIDYNDAFVTLWITTSTTTKLLFGIWYSTLGIVGDLMESSIKRLSNSKDSGKLLPGHGGILDRFDSTLLAIVFYKYLLSLQIVISSLGKEEEEETEKGSSSFLLTLLKQKQ